jgi:hypothetical protein
MPPRELQEVLKHVGAGRRAFLRQAMKGAAFATPVVASFGMGALPVQADHVNLAYVCHYAFGGPGTSSVPISVPAELPPGAPACCQTAVDLMRSVVILIGQTEIEADGAVLAPARRSRLMERLGTALRLLAQGIVASGPSCGPDRRYSQARLAVSDYKALAVKAGLTSQVLFGNADGILAVLEQLATGC